MKEKGKPLPADAHCHIDFEQFDEDREEVLNRINEHLAFVVNAGVDCEHNKKTLRLAEANEKIIPAIGLHPTYTESFGDLEKIKQQLRQNSVNAVGEIGLDHHHVTDEELRKKQKQVFEELVNFAEEESLPVVVHSREAEEEAVKVLERYEVETLLHCFNGSPELAERAVENGMIIGVTTQVLYSDRVQEIVGRIPLDSMVLETDSPYLYRGDRNEPINVRESAKKIADIKSREIEEVISSTTENCIGLFR